MSPNQKESNLDRRAVQKMLPFLLTPSHVDRMWRESLKIILRICHRKGDKGPFIAASRFNLMSMPFTFKWISFTRRLHKAIAAFSDRRRLFVGGNGPPTEVLVGKWNAGSAAWIQTLIIMFSAA